MTKKRKIISLIILSAGLTGAFLIIWQSAPAEKNPEMIGFAPVRENFLDFQKQAAGSNEILKKNISENDNKNLTNFLAQIYAQELIKKNPANLNPAEKSLQMPKDVEDISLPNEAIDEMAATAFAITYFTEKNIKTTADNSPAGQLAYIEKLRAVNQKNFGQFQKNLVTMLDEWILEQKKAELEKYAGAIPGEINDLLTMEVPAIWESFHLQNLNLWQKKLVAVNALLSLEKDPLKSILAIQQTARVLEENINIDKVLKDKYLDLAKKS